MICYRFGPVNRKSLCKINADLFNLVQYCIRFDTFGNSLDSHDMTYLINGFDHCIVNGILGDIPDKTPVYLQIVNGEVLEIFKRGQTGTEVIQREITTHSLEFLNKLDCLGQIGNRRCLSDLKADRAWRNIIGNRAGNRHIASLSASAGDG